VLKKNKQNQIYIFMQPSEILNLQKQGYTPCFISGVKPTGGNYNNKCAAYNESTGILLHGIAALDDRSGDTLPTKCGFLFATKVDGNWAKTGTKLITWYGTEVFDKINEEKSFTRGGGNGAGGASAASASPAAASAASAASAPGNASEAGQAAAAVPASAPSATPAAASAVVCLLGFCRSGNRAGGVGGNKAGNAKERRRSHGARY
jgi:hypothetical protein